MKDRSVVNTKAMSRRGFIAGAGALSLTACAEKSAPLPPRPNAQALRARLLVAAAEAQVGVTTIYDGAYRRIGFPYGDIEDVRGVCTDVVVRAYRRGLGIDLQAMVNADMHQAFYAYPNVEKWELTQPDPNIDHRRVLNLIVFFDRMGAGLPVTRNPRAFRPGDLVTQKLTETNNHIAMVTNRWSADGQRPLIVHNICCGVKVEDRLFEFPITGHFRYLPPPANPWGVDPALLARAERGLG